MGEVLLNFDGSRLLTSHSNCWMDRGGSMCRLVNKAFSKLSSNAIRKMSPFNKVFFENDHGDGNFTICSDRYTEDILPCYIFDHWKECKINDYEETCENIKKESIKKFKYDKMLWIGQISHPTRKKFVEKYTNNKNMNIIALPDHWGHSPVLKTPYISLPSHCDYKYLIDMQGNGYSGRFKFFLHSRRPVFYQSRKFHEYWFWSLKPFVHYIPINEDFSDFDEKFSWAEKNYDKCISIAQNAFDFACNNLRRKDAILRLKNIIYRLGTK
jgi:hypothetical protein